MTRDLTFKLFGRDISASKVVKHLGQESGKTASDLESHSHRIGSAMKGVGIAALGVAGVAGGALAATFKTGLGEVSDYQRGFAQLQAGLKSTGNVAGLSADQMEALASKIQGYSGQTDDSIVATEQLLLTFTNVRNEAGKGNDVFTRTTKVAADMAARMGGDASTQAIRLGKALNDPVKGISALAKVGVSFTDGQKKQVAAMVASGHTMGAQKLILGELNKEFGGSAKAVGDTLPGQIEKLKRHFEDFSQSVVTAVLPALLKVGGLIGDLLEPLFTKLGDAGYYLQEAIDAVRVGFQNSGPLENATGIFRDIETDVGALSTVFTEHLVPTLKTVWSFLQANILPIIEAVARFVIGTLAPALARILGAALDGLRAGLAVVSKAIASHREQLQTLGHAIIAVAGFIVRTLAPVIGTVLKVAFIVLGHAIGIIIDVLAGVIGASRKVAGFFAGPFVHAIGDLVSVAVKGFKFIADVWFGVVGGIIDGAAKAMGWVPGLGGKLKSAAAAFDGFHHAVDAKLSSIASDASNWGQKTGAGLAGGLVAGMDAHSMEVYKKARELGGQAAKSVQYGAQVQSPSKVTTYVGRMIAEGLWKGWSARAQELMSKLPADVQRLLTKMQSAIQAQMSKLHDQVTAARGRLQQDLASRGDLAKSIAGGVADSAGITGAIDSDTGVVGNVSTFLRGNVGTLRRFARDIGLLRKQGLAPALLQQISAAGPTQGLALAESILGGQSGSISSLNKAQMQIARYSGQIGTVTAGAVYQRQLARDHKVLDQTLTEQRKQTRALERIARSVEGTPSARELHRDLRKIRRVTGKKLVLS